MAKRGIIYILWGNDPKTEQALIRSRKSVAEIHPELPVEVIRVNAPDAVKGLLEKSRMFDMTPFEETIFLDADTVVLGRLDFAIAKAEQYGIACSICECPWAKRYEGIKGDIIEYNTGVLFFTRKAKNLFDAWHALSSKVDSSIIFIDDQGRQARMAYNDQASFALAVEQTQRQPFILPLNWNFRPQLHLSFFGPLKVWHGYDGVPPFIYEMIKYYQHPQSIIQFHGPPK